MLGLLSLLLSPLVEALPFVTTWNISQANATNVTLPPIYTQSSVTVNWGDSSSNSSANAGTLVNFSHTYAALGLYNVSIEGQIFWSSAMNMRGDRLVDIVSWGDGFLINQSSGGLFDNSYKLQVSAPANTQPVFLAGATLNSMFAYTAFNSSLDWDLANNVTSLISMFASTPLNKPITFRNTKNVTWISEMFQQSGFNQPFHFDASGLVDASWMFFFASSFNQVVNLTNSSKLTNTSIMFNHATSFNQPITFNISSVSIMDNMFESATSFNQPINFQASSKLASVGYMFLNAYSFNQPVVMNTSSVTKMAGMFSGATSFASTVNFTSTTKVTNMADMFKGVEWFTQDLSSWDISNVTSCSGFCLWCGLPSFPKCVPCSPRYNNSQNPAVSVCTNGTQSPSNAPTTRVPTTHVPTAPTAPPTASSAARAPSSPGLAVALLGTMLSSWLM